MNSIGYIALYACIPAVFVCFLLLSSRKAVLLSFLGAWLFLPVAAISMHGLPDYTKMSATCAGIMFAVLLFDTSRLTSFRLHWIDVVAILWCIAPFLSSITNGLGVYDGLSAALSQSVTWGLAYLIGRLYFNSRTHVTMLACALFVAGMIYVPLCLFEIRMSPQLNRWVYGFYREWYNVYRFGGYRPSVFMSNGLELGLWMTEVTLVGIWLWYTGAIKSYWRTPMWLLVGILTVTTILCKSTGALAELGMGLGALISATIIKARWPVVILALAPALYCAVRGTGVWDGQDLVDAAKLISNERAGSLEFRMDNENLLAGKARQRLVFGWGGWGRNRVYDDKGIDQTITDGLWIIVFGQRGLYGLMLLGTLLLAPPLLILRKIGTARNLANPEFAPAVALAVVVVLYAIDCLFNAMVNPVYMLCAGGLVGLVRNWNRIENPLYARGAAIRSIDNNDRVRLPRGRGVPVLQSNAAQV